MYGSLNSETLKSDNSAPPPPPVHINLGLMETQNVSCPTMTKTFTSSPLERLAPMLDQVEEFFFDQSAIIEICYSTPVVTQIMDRKGHPLLTAVHTPPPASILARGGNGVIRGSVIKFSDQAGNLMVTAAFKEVDSLTVTSGLNTLGVLDGCGSWILNMRARNCMDHPIFRIEKRTRDGVHPFVDENEKEIGSLARGGDQDGSVSLKISPGGLHLETKLLALVAGFMLFLHYFALTPCGPGLGRTSWILATTLKILLLVVLLFVLVLVVVINNY